MSDELDKLAAQGDALAAESAAANNPVPAAPGGELVTTDKPPMTNAQGCAAALGLLREGLVNLVGITSLAVTLSDDKIKQAADAMGPVLDKYRINFGGAIDRGPEVAALFTAGPIIWAAYSAAMAELASRQPARIDQAGQRSRVVTMADAAESMQGGPNG